MFILVTVTFMILPVLLLLEALAIQFTADTTDLSTSVQEAEEMGLARMLQAYELNDYFDRPLTRQDATGDDVAANDSN